MSQQTKLLNMPICPPHPTPPPHHRALRVRKKMSGDRMPVKMIGDILTNQLPHMQPYIRFHLLPLEHPSIQQHNSCVTFSRNS